MRACVCVRVCVFVHNQWLFPLRLTHTHTTASLLLRLFWQNHRVFTESNMNKFDLFSDIFLSDYKWSEICSSNPPDRLLLRHELPRQTSSQSKSPVLQNSLLSSTDTVCERLNETRFLPFVMSPRARMHLQLSPGAPASMTSSQPPCS